MSTRNIMIIGAILTVSSFASTSAFAGPSCDANATKLPMWQIAQEFENNNAGIKLMKVTSGHCYEIYGYTKSGDKVEIYYDPATGKTIKSVN